MVRRIASRRLIWPSIRLFQVGVFESSKSAMKTFAPELSALIIILRSTGPVISTRRSRISAGSGATVQAASRIGLRLCEEVGLFAGIEPLLPLVAGVEQRLAARIEGALQIDDEGNSLRRQNLRIAFADRSKELNTGNIDGTGHATQLPFCGRFNQQNNVPGAGVDFAIWYFDLRFQAKRRETLPAVEKRTFTCEPAEANVLPVQLPVVIQSPRFRPPVRAAPSFAR